MSTTIHDSGYKFLFSNRTIFRQLMESFVDQPWVQQLDFARAERVDKSFVDEEYQERESDLIYRVPFGDDAVYVYVLLEFQSTVDPLMALRMLNYVVNFYMDLARSEASLRRLPPIFPIVLYNGDGRWGAATDLAELIEDEPSLGDYALHFRYYKLAENEFSQGRLLQIGNIVSTLFLAESRYDQEQLLVELVNLFDREEDKQAVSLFINWFRQMAIHNRIRGEDYVLLHEAYRSSQEVQTMLTTIGERERQTFYEKGVEEGREEGRREILLAMADRGYNIPVIADMVGLTVAQVEEIIAQRQDRPQTDTDAAPPSTESTQE